MNAYHVTTDTFNGPLDLLLSLIEREKMRINEVSLAHVADHFLSFVKSREEYPVEEASEFITVAATLLLIKSRSLLPELPITDEEASDVNELERRLALLARYRELGKTLGARFGTHYLFPIAPHPISAPVFAPHPKLSVASLTHALHTLITRAHNTEKAALPAAEVKKTISIGEMMTRLRDRVISMPVRWSELLKEHGADRRSIAVCFLSILELLRHGDISVHQENKFSDIIISQGDVSVPQY